MRDARRTEIRTEASELAAELARSLLRTGDGDAVAVNELFRTAHSLKGLAGLLGAVEAVRLAHAIEDVLDDLRHGGIQLVPGLRAALQQAIDRCAALLHDEGAEDDGTVDRLHALRAEAAVEGGADCLSLLDLPPFVRDALTDYELARLRENVRLERHVHRLIAGFSLDGFDGGLEEIHRRVGEEGEQIATLPASTEAEISFEILVASRLDAGELAERLAGLVLRVEPVPRRRAAPAVEAPPEPPQRVRVALDALRSLEAEGRALAAAFAALAPALRTELAPLGAAIARIQACAHRLGHVTAADLCARAEQVVASVAQAWSRQVRLVAEGAEIELPVAVAEGLAEPLLHLVRNAFDHGIEMPGERLRRGKPIEGTIRLRFERDADGIAVELADDGGGIDPRRLEAAAAAWGIAWEGLGPEARLDLVFLPGFSTGGSDGRSGRGVGLDVVREAVRRLGGTVSVTSEPGVGTSFLLRLPDGAGGSRLHEEVCAIR